MSELLDTRMLPHSSYQGLFFFLSHPHLDPVIHAFSLCLNFLGKKERPMNGAWNSHQIYVSVYFPATQS